MAVPESETDFAPVTHLLMPLQAVAPHGNRAAAARGFL